MWYNITRVKNTFSISSSTGEPITIKLFKQDSCEEGSWVQIGLTQITVDDVSITLPDEDGVYRLQISAEIDNKDASISIIINIYDKMLLSLIDDIENILCGCKCKTCDDCLDTDKDISSVLLKLLAYYSVTSQYHAGFLSAALKCLKCSIVDANQCVILNERIIGNADNTMLLKRTVALYYLAFYFAEFNVSADTEFINDKFKYKKIKKCIEILGVDISCVTKNIDDMGLFTITSEAYINMPPSVIGDYSLTILNRAEETLTSGMFTNLTTPPYQDPEGDAPQAIRVDSLPSTGTLMFNTNPVTIGQIITIADINLNKLKYVAPNTNSPATATFNFSVRDIGSMIFSS